MVVTRDFGEALAEQSEMGWTPQQAAAAFATAVRECTTGRVVVESPRAPLRALPPKSRLPGRFLREGTFG